MAGAGNYTLVFTFQNNLMSVENAFVTTGSGQVSNSSIGPNANQYTVNLTGVTDMQYVVVTLQNAADSTGAVGNVVGPDMGVLIGDVNGTGNVDGNDVSAVQGATRQPVTSANFKLDSNTSGNIDGNDVSLVQSHTRQSLPQP